MSFVQTGSTVLEQVEKSPPAGSSTNPLQLVVEGRHRQQILQKCRRRVWHFLFLACSSAVNDESSVKYRFTYTLRARNVLNYGEEELGADENSLFLPYFAQLVFFLIIVLFYRYQTGAGRASQLATDVLRDFNSAFALKFGGERSVLFTKVTSLIHAATFLALVGAGCRLIDYWTFARSGRHFLHLLDDVDLSFQTFAALSDSVARGLLNLVFLFCLSESPSEMRRVAANNYKNEDRRNRETISYTAPDHAGDNSSAASPDAGNRSYWMRNLSLLFTAASLFLEYHAEKHHLTTLTTVYKYDTAAGEFLGTEDQRWQRFPRTAISGGSTLTLPQRELCKIIHCGG
eukprot:g7162.t1